MTRLDVIEFVPQTKLLAIYQTWKLIYKRSRIADAYIKRRTLNWLIFNFLFLFIKPTGMKRQFRNKSCKLFINEILRIKQTEKERKIYTLPLQMQARLRDKKLAFNPYGLAFSSTA